MTCNRFAFLLHTGKKGMALLQFEVGAGELNKQA